jgi:ribose transport system ATP-binding protein
MAAEKMNPGKADQAQADQALVVSRVTKRYPGALAVNDVSLEVRPGEVLALLGENGAGKSTLAGIISGITRPDSGTMTWKGAPYAPGSPRDARSAQIALIHQEMRLCLDLSVAENIFVGRLEKRFGGFIDRRKMNQMAEAELQRLGLNIPGTQLVSTLNIAAQQQVEIAKALTSKARLIILDEPTAALGGKETERLFEQIALLKQEGVAFIYISHRLEEIARIADRIAVMRDGNLITVHETADIPVHDLVEEMVGRKIVSLFPELPEPTQTEVLRVEGLKSFDGSFADVDFSVCKGEILGIAGIVGAGRTELVRAIAGVDPLAAGSIYIDGAKVRFGSPLDAMRGGVALVPEDRKAQGLVVSHTVTENITLPNLETIGRSGWVLPNKLAAFTAKGIQELGVKGRPEQRLSSLSGGNQQKVVIAKWVARSPRIFILDEPTRGIDVGARYEIYCVITELARSGMAVIIVSSDLDEVLGMSHRVLVLSRGKQRGVLPRAQATGNAIMELATS